MKMLAVIPARGGSKGVHRKNLYPLGGQPLIGRTISAALRCPLITELVVSSEDEEILEVSRSLGVDSLIKRPLSLATDNAQSAPVIIHALDIMEERTKKAYDWVLMLQPTSPFRTAKHISSAVEHSKFAGADSVVSVVSVGAHHPLRMKTDENGWMKNFVPQTNWNMKPRQELPPVYIRNGAIYLIKASVLRATNQLIGDHCRIFIMNENDSLNIDSIADIREAERIIGDNSD